MKLLKEFPMAILEPSMDVFEEIPVEILGEAPRKASVMIPSKKNYEGIFKRIPRNYFSQYSLKNLWKNSKSSKKFLRKYVEEYLGETLKKSLLEFRQEVLQDFSLESLKVINNLWINSCMIIWINPYEIPADIFE